MNRAEIKQAAKDELRGNWGWATIVGLAITVINAVIFGPNIKEYIDHFTTGSRLTTVNLENILEPGIWAGHYARSTSMGFFSGFFMLSMAITFLHLARGRRLPSFKAIFSVFTDDRFIPEFLNYLLSSIFEELWMLLLVIPGIIKYYSYAMTPYIVSDMVESGQTVHATTAITASRQLMAGHKWELFVLNLSFLGWEILALIPFGIGLIWLIPYMHTTRANFYRQLAGDQFRRNPRAANLRPDAVE